MARRSSFEFARLASDGKWYTYAEFYHFYSGCGANLMGDDDQQTTLTRRFDVAKEKEHSGDITR